MVTLRERGFKREIKLNGLLVFIQTVVWKVSAAAAAANVDVELRAVYIEKRWDY